MSDLSLSLRLTDASQGRIAVKGQLLPFIGGHLQAGRALAVTVKEAEDERTLKQNAFMWGFVLKTISRQAVIDGIGADERGWHLFFKRRLLGYRVRKVKVPGKKRPSITRELRSTTGLSVKRMSAYLEEMMATAATEFGVTFEPDRRWEDWNVDQETGEMMRRVA